MNENKMQQVPNIFADDRYSLRPKHLFYYLFNEICSIYTFNRCKFNSKINEILIEKYSKNESYKVYIDYDEFVDTNKSCLYSYYILNKNLMVWFFDDGAAIYYVEGFNNKEFEELKSIVSLNIIRTEKQEPKYYMIFEEFGSLELKEFKARIVNTNIDTHYNSDFEKINEKITSFISQNKSGIVLLHGKSGTGKTTYIRYLINNFDKKFIYIPAEMVVALTKPSFLPFISEYPDSVLIIEDCEELLFQRTSSNHTNSALINLLNLSDGLIGDGFRLKFLCVFNTAINNIDKALLRKGRLIANYEFLELETEKANNLIKIEKLAIPNLNQPVALAEIYHYDNAIETPVKKKIGFKNG